MAQERIPWLIPPDPAFYRHQLPGHLWRRWESGHLTLNEFWFELERFWGREDVLRLLGLPIDRQEAA
jgi:hypothetical protein